MGYCIMKIWIVGFFRIFLSDNPAIRGFSWGVRLVNSLPQKIRGCQAVKILFFGLLDFLKKSKIKQEIY